MLIKRYQCIVKHHQVHFIRLSISQIKPSVHLGAHNLVELRLVDTLLKKLISELDEIKELILNTIHFCLMVDVEQALAADAMSTLTSLLDHPSDRIKTLAALAIFHLR